MQQKSVWPYIGFGTALRYLQDVGAGWPIKTPGGVLSNLRWFLRELEELNLVITAKVARSEDLYTQRDAFDDAADDAVTTPEEATALSTAVTTVRKTLVAEAQEKKAFVTSPKRWDVDKLLSDPSALFAEDVFDSLNEHATYDFEEAAKCIAFERPTAAAFHIMRGTEAVLRAFYCDVVKRNRLRPDRQLWGPMISQLEDRSKPPPSSMLDNLDAIRKNFRNPTQHPEAIYDIDRAQDLLGLVSPAINQMVSLMKA